VAAENKGLLPNWRRASVLASRGGIKKSRAKQSSSGASPSRETSLHEIIFWHNVASAFESDPGMAEFVQTDGENPANRNDNKTVHFLKLSLRRKYSVK
jgi:hypothetical protein